MSGTPTDNTQDPNDQRDNPDGPLPENCILATNLSHCPFPAHGH